MKKLKYLILLVPLLVLMAYSSNGKDSSDSDENISNETPEVLIEDSDSRSSYFSKGRNPSDIIQKLYKEAIKKMKN